MPLLVDWVSGPLWWFFFQLQAYAPLIWIFSTIVGASCQGYLGDKCLSDSSGCFGELCLSRVALPFICGIAVWALVWAKRYNRYAGVVISILSHPAAILIELLGLAYQFRLRICTWYPDLLELGRSEWWANEFLRPSRWSPARWLIIFLVVAVWKGVKVVVQTYSYYILTNPHQPASTPKFQPRDVTVIIPTVGTFGPEMEGCVNSILANHPKEILISTIGQDKAIQAVAFAAQVNTQKNTNKVQVVAVISSSKREQFIKASQEVGTRIIATADDNVLWPETFLRSALAPFEDDTVGLVGTAKTVTRDRSGDFIDSFVNYLACMDLERHNFENTATYNLDGGVSVISGQTALIRANIVRTFEYETAYRNEFYNPPVLCHPYWPYQLLLRVLLWSKRRRNGVGPMSDGDDYFNTRYMVNHGLKTVFHNHPDAITRTALGVEGFEKFSSQILRWDRTTWRSNAISLFQDHATWTAYPLTTYAMSLSSFYNFSLFVDPLLFISLYNAGYRHRMCALAIVLAVTKFVKPFTHLMRGNWEDIFYVPFGILFGYCHSPIKLWAFLTSTNIGSSSRTGRTTIDERSEIEKVVDTVLPPFWSGIRSLAASVSASWDSLAIQIGNFITSFLTLPRSGLSALDSELFGNIASNMWNHSAFIQFRQVLYDHTIQTLAEIDSHAWISTQLGICLLFTSQLIYNGFQNYTLRVIPIDFLIIATVGVAIVRLVWAAAKVMFPNLGWAAAMAQLRASASYPVPSLLSTVSSPSRPAMPLISSYQIPGASAPGGISLGVSRRTGFSSTTNILFFTTAVILVLAIISTSMFDIVPEAPWNFVASVIPVQLPAYNIDRWTILNKYYPVTTELVNEWSAFYVPTSIDQTIRTLSEQAILATKQHVPEKWILEHNPFENKAVVTLATVGGLMVLTWVGSVVLDFTHRIVETGTGIVSFILLIAFLAWTIFVLLFIGGYVINSFASSAVQRTLDYLQDSQPSRWSFSDYSESSLAPYLDAGVYYAVLIVIIIALIPQPRKPSGGTTRFQVLQAGVAILDILWLALRYVAVFGLITFLRFIRWRKANADISADWFPSDLPGYIIALLIILIAVLIKTGGFKDIGWGKSRTATAAEVFLWDEHGEDGGAGDPPHGHIPPPPTPRNPPRPPPVSHPTSIGSQPPTPSTARSPRRPTVASTRTSPKTPKASPKAPISPPKTPPKPRSSFIGAPKSPPNASRFSPKTPSDPRPPFIGTPRTPPASPSTRKATFTSTTPTTPSAQLKARVVQVDEQRTHDLLADNPMANKKYIESMNAIRAEGYNEEWNRQRREMGERIDWAFSAGRRGRTSWWTWLWKFFGALVGAMLSLGRWRAQYVPLAESPRPSGDVSYPVLPQFEDSEAEIMERVDDMIDQAIEEVADAAFYNNKVYAENAEWDAGHLFGGEVVGEVAGVESARKKKEQDDADPSLDFLPFAPRKSPRALGVDVH